MIPSPPLALFIVMLSKAHLTSHSRMLKVSDHTIMIILVVKIFFCAVLLCHCHLISHTSKIMLKILQARLQQYMHSELPDIQAGFRKGRGTRDQIANIHWIMEKAREF